MAGNLAESLFVLSMVAAAPLTLGLVGFVRPQVKEPPQAVDWAQPGDRLDGVVILVNGEPHLVEDGGEIALFYGDEVEVQSAVLRDNSRAPRTLDVVGLPDRPGAAAVGGDRGRAFRTTELVPRHSLDGKGSVFAVVAHTKKLRHGAVYFRLVDPVLRWAEMSVNGTTRIVRDGEPLALGAADRIQIGKVATSLAGRGTDVPDDVMVEVVPAAAAEGGGRTRYFEIRFTRAGRSFAMIPLVVRE